MNEFLNLAMSGLVTGAIYSIMASGLVLTYQTSGIFNFAHGAVAFTTAFVYYQLHTGQGIPIVPAAIISVLVFAPLLGLALDRILLRRLASAPVYARIVGTIGLGHIARERGVAETGYRILSNTGPAAHQEVSHFHVHLVGGRDLGAMLPRG